MPEQTPYHKSELRLATYIDEHNESGYPLRVHVVRIPVGSDITSTAACGKSGRIGYLIEFYSFIFKAGLTCYRCKRRLERIGYRD